MHKIPDDFENWSDRIIILRVIRITRSVLIFLKLADKVDMDEILDEFETWLDRTIVLQLHPTHPHPPMHPHPRLLK